MNAIKESIDNLPAAICIFNAKGLVRLMNRRMLAVGSWLLGSGIQTLGKLREVLESPPETVTKDASMPGVYHFPDGSALRFSENEITDRDGQRYAVAHNEMEHYTASLRISAACKNMIEDAIAAAYQDNSLKDVREASKAVIDTFGFDRTMFVLANTIRIKSYDGRISPENKTWAQTIPVCEDQLNILVDRCNPGLLDLFTNQVRKDFAAEQQRSQQKVSVREKLHGTPVRAAERSASSKRDWDAR